MRKRLNCGSAVLLYFIFFIENQRMSTLQGLWRSRWMVVIARVAFFIFFPLRQGSKYYEEDSLKPEEVLEQCNDIAR